MKDYLDQGGGANGSRPHTLLPFSPCVSRPVSDWQLKLTYVTSRSLDTRGEYLTLVLKAKQFGDICETHHTQRTVLDFSCWKLVTGGFRNRRRNY